MKYQQIKLRLETLILKTRQQIWGYKSAIVRTKEDRKRDSYTALIKRLENRIGRINEDLDYCMMYQYGDINFKELCSKFRFRGYNQ